MTYQDQQIQKLMREFELAIITQFDKPSLAHSQELSKARHNLMKFVKEANTANKDQ